MSSRIMISFPIVFEMISRLGFFLSVKVPKFSNYFSLTFLKTRNYTKVSIGMKLDFLRLQVAHHNRDQFGRTRKLMEKFFALRKKQRSWSPNWIQKVVSHFPAVRDGTKRSCLGLARMRFSFASLAIVRSLLTFLLNRTKFEIIKLATSGSHRRHSLNSQHRFASQENSSLA